MFFSRHLYSKVSEISNWSIPTDKELVFSGRPLYSKVRRIRNWRFSSRYLHLKVFQQTPVFQSKGAKGQEVLERSTCIPR